MSSKEQFINIYKSDIQRAGADRLLEYLEKSDFFTAPASTKYHLSKEGGLCEHSINVYQALLFNYRRLRNEFSSLKEISDESIAITSLLHDVCKIGCYKNDFRNVKIDGKWEKVPCYKFEEDFKFGGHGSKSVYIISQFMHLTLDEAAAINCHMGPWGNYIEDYKLTEVYNTNLLAYLLHAADEEASFLVEVLNA